MTTDDTSPALRAVLGEKLGESLTDAIPSSTPRVVHGTVSLPGKATAVIGMRRAGKTTFLHQLRRERLDRNVRRRMVNPRKAYPVDPGLIPVFDPSGRPNIGHALETVVLIELERRGARVSYVRTPEGREVDFLVRSPGGGQELLQVCADSTSATVADRELRALDEAGRLFPEAKKRLLILTLDGSPREVPAGVAVQPTYEWLLTR